MLVVQNDSYRSLLSQLFQAAGASVAAARNPESIHYDTTPGKKLLVVDETFSNDDSNSSTVREFCREVIARYGKALQIIVLTCDHTCSEAELYRNDPVLADSTDFFDIIARPPAELIALCLGSASLDDRTSGEENTA
jgi:hypothetical protein